MIIEELILRNFGVYKGQQSFNLSPESTSKPVILVGGQNGGGKTTVIDAIQLALYGPLAKVSNRRNLGYERYLRKCIHTEVDPMEGAGVELALGLVSAGEEYTLQIRRSWRMNGKGLVQEFEVRRNGQLDALLTERWPEHVESLVPSGIASLFFFDGERIKALAEPKSSGKLLSTAIKSLLGLDLVDQLDGDLLVLAKRKATSLASSVDQKEICRLEEAIEHQKEELLSLRQTSAGLKVRLERAEKELREAETEFKASGGDLVEEREGLLADRDATAQELVRVWDCLRDVAAGPLPLRLIQELTHSVDAQAEHERERQERTLLQDVVAKHDKEVSEMLRAHSAGSLFGAKVVEFIIRRVGKAAEELRKQKDKSFSETSIDEEYVQLSTEGRQLLREWHNRECDAVAGMSNGLITDAESQDERLGELDRKVSSIPDEESIASLVLRLRVAEKAVEGARGEIAEMEVKRDAIVRVHERDSKKLSRVLEKLVDEDFATEDAARVVKSTKRTRETLGVFRKAVVDQHIGEISRLVLGSFNELLHKKSLVSEIEINQEDFTVALVGGDGSVRSTSRLSAGERQLLAVSLLWGLARASGYPLPVIIDTPLGRLDAAHRTNLVERYFPNASHQVILLSTDKEIDEECLDKLRPALGKSYLLDFDDTSQCTTIRPGYFWGN